MNEFFRRYRKSLFLGIVAVFLLSTFVGLGGYLFIDRDVSAAVASVGAVKIPYMRFRARVDQYAEALRGRGTEINEEAVAEIKKLMLQDMIVDELLLTKADEMGLVVTDEELSRDIQNTPVFQSGGAFNQELYFRAVRTVFHDTPEAYEESRRRTLKVMRLKQLIYQAAKVAPAELRENYAEAHKGSFKDFEKQKDAFASKLRERRAIELINFFLRQLQTQVEIRSYLDQREKGQ